MRYNSHNGMFLILQATKKNVKAPPNSWVLVTGKTHNETPTFMLLKT